MNRFMSREFLPILCVGLIGVWVHTGCSTSAPGTGGGGNVNDNTDGNQNDNFTPEGVTFGGIQPPREEVVAHPQAINPYAASASAQLPAMADLTKDLPPIGNQGAMPSCTAWAAGYSGATYTANRQYDWGADSADHQASPAYLYEQLLEADSFDCGSGTRISTAMNLLVQNGCSSLATVDYTDQACVSDPSSADASNFQIGSFNRVVETDRHAIRAELAAGRLVVFGARLYDDFPNATGSEVYRGSGNFLSQGNQHAAHAMALVGYDDNRGAYRVMNSWSPDWGDQGFMWMAYETFEATAFEAYSIEPSGDREPDPTPDPGPDPGPDPEPGPDPQGTIDDAFQFADADPVTREQLVYLVFYWHFDAPVFIRTVTVTDPSGNVGQQTYDTWYLDGYVYFVQSGGFQWEAGTYTLEFDTQTEAGNDVLYTAMADVAPLGEDGGDDGGVCSNVCIFAFDGECDDGGPGSDYFLCDYGTDCDDCGVREEQGGGDTICTDACRFAGDGECDDGGPGALYFECDFGTDCTDCGPRSVDDVITDEFCDDSCRFAFDGECDDGGVGSDFDVCEFGSDCFDCGPRTIDDFIDDEFGEEICEDTCEFAFDGVCDDGGLGAIFAVCDFGTDCADCGPRTIDSFIDDDFDDDFIDEMFCEDTCEFAFDGVCDDGGLGAEFDACVFGTDCADCGPRTIDDFIDGVPKVVVPRKFRGVTIETPAGAAQWPAAGVREGILGANRQPAKVMPSAASK